MSCFVITGCKKEVDKKQVALSISGMTCEIGCAKTIQSKLSKKEGVLNAKVIFTDSIATIEYNANKTTKDDLITFVNGIAGGDLYKASETSFNSKNIAKETHKCTEACKEKCTMSATKKQCKEDCKMDCCTKKMAK